MAVPAPVQLDDDEGPVDAVRLAGANILFELVKHNFDKGTLAAADSAFGSVEAMMNMCDNGYHLTAVIKSCTKGYPMKKMKETNLVKRGDYVVWTSTYVSDNKTHPLHAVLYADKHRRQYLSSAGGTIPGSEVKRRRLEKQTGKSVDYELDQPKMVEVFHKVARVVDDHNSRRQSPHQLGLERGIKTFEWSRRLACSLLGTLVVDAYLIYAGHCRHFEVDDTKIFTQDEFIRVLVAELTEPHHKETSFKRYTKLKRYRRRSTAAAESGSPAPPNPASSRQGPADYSAYMIPTSTNKKGQRKRIKCWCRQATIPALVDNQTEAYAAYAATGKNSTARTKFKCFICDESFIKSGVCKLQMDPVERADLKDATRKGSIANKMKTKGVIPAVAGRIAADRVQCRHRRDSLSKGWTCIQHHLAYAHGIFAPASDPE